MSTESNTLAVHAAPKASDQLASFLGIDKGMMLNTLKAQCFAGKRPEEVTDEQLAAFVSTANVLQVNPLIAGMLYAFPSKNGGIVPVLGPDGVFKKLDEMISNGKLLGFECAVFPEDVTQKPTHAVATIYRGKDLKPATYTALHAEWVMQNSPVWSTKPRHMLWTRAIKQCARQVIHGLPMDAEEYAMSEMQNVTPLPVGTPEAPITDRPAPKPRATKGVKAAVETPAVEVETKVVPAATAEVAAAPAQTPAPAPEAHADLEPAAAPAAAPMAAPAPSEDIDETPAAPQGRSTLEKNEIYDTVIEVAEIAPILLRVAGVQTPSLSIVAKGGFNGPLYVFGEAVGEGVIGADNYKMTPKPGWKVGAKYKVRLHNKVNPKSGNPVLRAETFEALEDRK